MHRRSKRLRYPSKAAIAALLVYASCVPPAFSSELLTRQLDVAPAALPQLEREGPWLRVCEAGPAGGGGQCRYEQMAWISANESVGLMLLGPPAGAPPVALIRTPLGVLLTDGVTVSFDGRAGEKIAFRACNPLGCLAPLPLDAARRSRIANSNRMKLEFTSQEMKPYSVEFSLARSAAILKEM